MKIKIEIDVPEYAGGTLCDECPFGNESICFAAVRKYCDKVDYSRMIIKELNESLRTR